MTTNGTSKSERIEGFINISSCRIIHSSYMSMMPTVMFIKEMRVEHLCKSVRPRNLMPSLPLMYELMARQPIDASHVAPHKNEHKISSHGIAYIVSK